MNSDNEQITIKKPKSMELTALLILIFGLWGPVKSVMLTFLERKEELPDMSETQGNTELHYLNLALGAIYILISLGIYSGKNFARIAFFIISPVILALDFYLFSFQFSFLIKPALFIIFIFVLTNSEFSPYFKTRR